MATVYFRTRDVRPLILQIQQQAQADGVPQPDPPASAPDADDALPRLLLVNDLSLYLTSTALLPPEGAQGLRPVAFAEGLNPRDNPGWFEQVTAMVGYDHFAQPLPLEPLERLCASEPDGYLAVTLEDAHVRVSAQRTCPPLEMSA